MRAIRAVPTPVRTASSSRWTRLASRRLRDQLHSGAKRLQLPCPFPEVVDKVRDATAKKGHPQDPQVALLEIEDVADGPGLTLGSPAGGHAAGPARRRGATRAPRRVPRAARGPQGALLGSCPKVPSDLEAKVGYHVDTKTPSKKEAVFGYVHLKTTDLNRELGLELPLGNSTYPGRRQ